jgi:hypothetical protein
MHLNIKNLKRMKHIYMAFRVIHGWRLKGYGLLSDSGRYIVGLVACLHKTRRVLQWYVWVTVGYYVRLA